MEDRPQNKPEGDTAQDFSIEKIEGLRDLLQDEIIGLESGDLRTKNKEEHDQAKQKLDKEKKKRPHSFYRDLIFSLTGLRLDERWARADWEEILKHKYQMSERLGRNVGLRVAALDFYMNIKKRLNRAVVVAVDTLTDALEQSITDSLTGAYNRGYFDGAMKRYFQRARVTQKIFSMLLLDVDYFKNYNDNNGHITGDIALIEMVRILHAVTRREDIVARYGGEEFAVIFPDANIDEAYGIAESVRLSFKDYRFPNEASQPGGNLTVSGGVVMYTDDLQDGSEMIVRADEALYQAKREGRNRIISYKGIA